MKTLPKKPECQTGQQESTNQNDDVVDHEVDQPRLLGLVVQRHVRQGSFLWGTLLCIFLFTAYLWALSTPEMSTHGLLEFLVPGMAAFVTTWLSMSILLLTLPVRRAQNPQITLLTNNNRLIERIYVSCAGGRVWLTLVAMSLLLPDPDTSLANRATIVFLMSSAGLLAALADCCATLFSLKSHSEKGPS
jgi:hypothetical protein